MKNIQYSKIKKVLVSTAIFVFIFSAISTDLKSQTSFSDQFETVKTDSPDNSQLIKSANVETKASVIVYPNIRNNFV